MAEVKHTPWEVVPANEHHGFYVVDVAGRTVCDLYFIDRSDVDGGVRQFDGADRYARLIAAAPDLLAVAIKSHEPYEGLSEDDIHSLYGPEEAELALSLRAALSKATTQQEGR